MARPQIRLDNGADDGYLYDQHETHQEKRLGGELLPPVLTPVCANMIEFLTWFGAGIDVDTTVGQLDDLLAQSTRKQATKIIQQWKSGASVSMQAEAKRLASGGKVTITDTMRNEIWTALDPEVQQTLIGKGLLAMNAYCDGEILRRMKRDGKTRTEPWTELL